MKSVFLKLIPLSVFCLLAVFTSCKNSQETTDDDFSNGNNSPAVIVPPPPDSSGKPLPDTNRIHIPDSLH